MKKYAFGLLIASLMLASLACQTALGGGGGSPSSTTEESSNEPGSSLGVDTDFPLPDDATNVTETAGGVNFQTEMSVEEVMDFYRDVLTGQGYTERQILTDVTDGVFSFVFDGHESGQSFVIQGFDLKDGTTNVNIRLEFVN